MLRASYFHLDVIHHSMATIISSVLQLPLFVCACLCILLYDAILGPPTQNTIVVMTCQLESHQLGSTTTPQPTEGVEEAEPESELTLLPGVEEAQVQLNKLQSESKSVPTKPECTSISFSWSLPFSESNTFASLYLSLHSLFTPPIRRSLTMPLKPLSANATDCCLSSQKPNFLMETF